MLHASIPLPMSILVHSLTHDFLSSAVGLTIESDFYATEAGRAHFAVSITPNTDRRHSNAPFLFESHQLFVFRDHRTNLQLVNSSKSTP